MDVFHERMPVGETGQAIDCRQAGQFLFVALLVRHVADDQYCPADADTQ